MKNISLILLMIIALTSVGAVAQTTSPKREMRATWLTTVWRLDWPSVTVPAATGTNEAQRLAAINQQKSDLIRILDGLKAANMNATFMQVRSMCDAMYPSSYEPWSQFISSVRGADPGWDPLAFAIEEAHKRGIELHAWINPYRYSTSQTTHGELPTDYFHTNRNWLLAYDSFTKILNPGLPQVVSQIKKIVGEVVNKYDVDGIIFDDYFYSYSGTNSTLDIEAQNLFRPAGKDLGDWRRENVNRMIAAVYDTIQKVKPWVTFGVSPFGTWTTNQNVAKARGVPLPTGIGTTADMYSQIYCDPVAWLEEGTVDYLSPQLYWTTFSAFPYGRLAPWWSELCNRFGKHFYSSHSISGMTSGTGAPPAPNYIRIENEDIPLHGVSMIERSALERKTETTLQKASSAIDFAASEVGLQIDFNRTGDINGAPGSVFYATARLVNTAGFINYLKTNKFTAQSLVPAIGWKTTSDQGMVENMAVNGNVLSWTYQGTNMRYAVYAVPNNKAGEAGAFYNQEHLVGVSYTNSFTLPTGISTGTHKIGVSVNDRYGNEFNVRVLGENLTVGSPATLTYPSNGSEIMLPTIFRWEAVAGAHAYLWQLSKNAQFTDLVCSRETTQPSFFSGLQTNIKENTQYFWRVMARKANTQNSWSETRSFSGNKFRIISPQNNEGDVSLTPTLTWAEVGPAAVYTLDISTGSDFAANKQVISQVLNATTSYTVPANTLLPMTSYFARVSVNDGSIQALSEAITFTTRDVFIPVPVISSPTNGAIIGGKNIQICWQQQYSRGFRVEYSRDPLFPGRGTTVRNLDAFTYCTTFENLSSSTYHFRVRALRASDTTEPSATVSVLLDEFVSVLNPDQNNSLKYFVLNDGRMNIESPIETDVTVSVFDMAGSLILKKNLSLKKGNNPIDESRNLSRGVYILLVQNVEFNDQQRIIINP